MSERFSSGRNGNETEPQREAVAGPPQAVGQVALHVSDTVGQLGYKRPETYASASYTLEPGYKLLVTEVPADNEYPSQRLLRLHGPEVAKPDVPKEYADVQVDVTIQETTEGWEMVGCIMNRPGEYFSWERKPNNSDGQPHLVQGHGAKPTEEQVQLYEDFMGAYRDAYDASLSSSQSPES